jgi:aspartate/methionine/tyrosine aminotransferase
VQIDYPPDLLAPLSSSASLVYDPHPFGLPAARAAVAGEFARRGIEVPVGRIVLTASTSEAYSILFKLLCDPADRVLVPRPSYPLFEHLTRLDAVEADGYLLECHGRWSIDLDSIRAALSPRTRAILVVSPNNPTGSYLDDRDLAVLGDICRERDLALIGDEVFADYPLADRPPSPGVLTVADVLTFSLGGLSKSAGLPQLKLGWIGVNGRGDLVASALRRLEVICDSYLSVSTPVQQAAGSLIARGAGIRAQIAARIKRNYAALVDLIGRHPACAVLPAEGGWYGVIRVPATRSEEDLVLALLERDAVVTYPGYFFDFPREAFLVVSLLAAPDTFDTGVARLLRRASIPDNAD